MRLFVPGLVTMVLAGASVAGIAQETPTVDTPSDSPLDPMDDAGPLDSMDQQQMFETLDENGDNRLDPEEAGAAEGDDPAFSVIDANGDGYISRDEYGTNRPNQRR